MWQDIRAAVRGFRQSPGFAFTALATLTLAIAANSTVFSLLNALVGRDADVRDPRSLVQISSIAPPQNVESGLTYAMYDDFKRRQQAFSSVIGWRSNGIYNIDGIDGGAQHSRGLVAAVSGNFFDELGARAAAGRLLAESDIHEPSVEPSMVAVLGHAFWRRAFASDSAAIGRRVSVEGTAFTVIGVAPPHFLGLGMYIEPDVTVPLTAFPKIAGYAPGSLLTNPADTFFAKHLGRRDLGVVVAMYHDQGLIAAKRDGIGGAANVTLGLPFVRSSVDHGTAFDRAWKGGAKRPDPAGLATAVRVGADLANRAGRRRLEWTWP